MVSICWVSRALRGYHRVTFQPRSVLAPSVGSLSLVQQPENGRHCGDAGPLEHKNERFLAGFVLTPKILQVCWSTESTSCCTKQTLYIYHIQKSIKIIKDIKRHGPMRSNLAHAGYWLVKLNRLERVSGFQHPAYLAQLSNAEPVPFQMPNL